MALVGGDPPAPRPPYVVRLPVPPSPPSPAFSEGPPTLTAAPLLPAPPLPAACLSPPSSPPPPAHPTHDAGFPLPQAPLCLPYPLPSLPAPPTLSHRPAGAAACVPVPACPGTLAGVGTSSSSQGKVALGIVGSLVGWLAGLHLPTLPISSTGTPVSPCTHGHPPSLALCLFAPLSRAPCCPLCGVPPARVPSPGALLTLLLSLAYRAHYARPYRLLLVPHPCPAPRCLCAHFAGFHPLALPPAGRGTPPPLRCFVLPALPRSAPRHWAARCAPLPTPPAPPSAPTLSSLTPSATGRWCPVPAPGAGRNNACAPRAPAPCTAPPAGSPSPSPPPPVPPH